MPSKQKIVIILGSTASGKTSLSLDIAQKLNGEIISADSMQVYHNMDIGTAKLPPAERRDIPHHLIDICEPNENFNVADFRKLALEKIDDISARGRLPIIVGGTGLYINSLIRPYHFFDSLAVNEELRNQLRQRLAEYGNQAMHNHLAKLDPEAADRIHPNDEQRLIRALEICLQSGVTGSSIYSQPGELPPLEPLLLGLTMERDNLYRNIELRVDEMLEQGLVAEVQALLDRGISRQCNSMQGLGYRQIAAYLAGEVSYEQAVENLKRDTRRFAKRQMTWFKRNQDINWFYRDHYREADVLMHDVLLLIERNLNL